MRRSISIACRPRSTAAGSIRRKLVDLAALRSAGLISKPLDGVRLLARGELKSALTIAVDSASRAAVAAVEQAGGTLTLAHPRNAPAADEAPAPAAPQPGSEPARAPASE